MIEEGCIEFCLESAFGLYQIPEMYFLNGTNDIRIGIYGIWIIIHANRAWHEEGVLWKSIQTLAHKSSRNGRNINSINYDGPFSYVKHTKECADQGAFATAASTTDAELLAGLDIQVYIFDCKVRRARQIRCGDILEDDGPGSGPVLGDGSYSGVEIFGCGSGGKWLEARNRA